jgi:hypothetical protein
MSIGNPSWKGYDIETKKPCSNWGISGKKQIKTYKLCKKWGKDPQKEFNRIWDAWLNELSNNEARLQELDQKIEYLTTQRELIKKNNGNSVIVNEKLIKDVDDKINQITDGITYKWIYAVVKNLSYRHDMSYNEMDGIFSERIPQLIKNNQYKEQLLYLFKYVKDRAKNGTLSDTEIDVEFPRPVRA